MGFQNVRAIQPVKHDDVTRIPGVTTGPNAQDFVVSDQQAAALVALAAVTSLGVADEPTDVSAMQMLVGRESGRAVAPYGAASGAVLRAVRDATGVPYAITTLTKTNQVAAVANKTALALAFDGRYLRIEYVRTGGTPTGTVLYVAINAATSAEADAVLVSPILGRYAIPLGSFLELEFPVDSPLRRIDFVSDAATEAGTTLVSYAYGVPA